MQVSIIAMEREEKAMSLCIDGMMHLEVVGDYWDGLIDDVIEQYNVAGIDIGVVMATWMESRRSNDIVASACARYPDRFIPFAHVRPVDRWQAELERVTQELHWTGLKLHQGELRYGGGDGFTATRTIIKHASRLGVTVVKLHLDEYEAIDRLTREFSDIVFILPHMGCYLTMGKHLRQYCDLARERENVYLDTSCTEQYYDLDLAIEWAGVDKVTFASDGSLYSPLVERAKIDALKLTTPHRRPRLGAEDYTKIMGGNMARLLGIDVTANAASR